MKRGARAIARAAAHLPALIVIAACGGDSDIAVRDSVALAGPPAERDSTPLRREVMAVQVAALPDSLAAMRLRDSLSTAGWQAHVRRGGGDSLPPWRVRVAPTREPGMAQLTTSGFVQRGWKAVIVPDSAVLRPPPVKVLRANNGTAGAIASVRWLSSPDRRALVLVEDASAVENEPLPDGFIYVAEGGSVIQQDSVWDVAPSPDWRRLAYGSAYIISVEGRDSVGVRQWAAVAGRTNLDVNVIRRGAFPVSSMNYSYGFAQPVVEPTHPDSQGSSRLLEQVRRPVPVSGGWRLRWTPDGLTLAVGLSPIERARDDSPPSGWLAVDADDYLLRGPLPGSSAPAAGWQAGLVLDSSVPLPLERRRAEVAGGWVESEGGWVVMRSTRTGGARRVLGPGVLLGATRTGEFVAVVAPDPAAPKDGPPSRALIYRVGG
ncbi:MAG: hypothetical protein ACYC2G_01815 [Gemmatimonadaceae bacterium]